MTSIAQMARLMTGQPVKLPSRRPTSIERFIERAEAVQQGERARIASYSKYLRQRGFVVLPSRDYERLTNPHQPQREGTV